MYGISMKQRVFPKAVHHVFLEINNDFNKRISIIYEFADMKSNGIFLQARFVQNNK
jgi:hypothetical protein